jgi:hypothetical protein
VNFLQAGAVWKGFSLKGVKMEGQLICGKYNFLSPLSSVSTLKTVDIVYFQP